MKFDTYQQLQELIATRFEGTDWAARDVHEYVRGRLAERGEPVPTFSVVSVPLATGDTRPMLVLQ